MKAILIVSLWIVAGVGKGLISADAGVRKMGACVFLVVFIATALAAVPLSSGKHSGPFCEVPISQPNNAKP